MSHAQKMKAVIENATRNTQATVWLDRFRSIREVEGPQRIPSALMGTGLCFSIRKVGPTFLCSDTEPF
jgi:hypothetical protein